MVTKVTYSRLFEKQIQRLPKHIKFKVSLWVLTVQTEGIGTTMQLRHFRDESLKGQRQGQRSIRLNRAYRLIYEVVEGNVHIHVLEVNKHEY